MGTWLTITGTLLMVVLAKFLADDFREFLVWSRKRLIRAALKKLPAEARTRYAEEWEADLADKPGEGARLLWALGCYQSAADLAFMLRSDRIATFSTTLTQRVLWRIIDLLVAQAAIVAVLPVLLLMTLAVRLSVRGSVLTRIEVIGRYGQRFAALTYTTTIPSNYGEEAFTNVGLFLYRARVNTLPLLLNILKGEMSIIGPAVRTSDEFTALRRDHQEIYTQLRPGLLPPTIMLYHQRGEAAEHFEFEYLRTRTFMSDLKLVATAAWGIVFVRSS